MLHKVLIQQNGWWSIEVWYCGHNTFSLSNIANLLNKLHYNDILGLIKLIWLRKYLIRSGRNVSSIKTDSPNCVDGTDSSNIDQFQWVSAPLCVIFDSNVITIHKDKSGYNFLEKTKVKKFTVTNDNFGRHLTNFHGRSQISQPPGM